MENILDELNASQREAVTTTEGIVRVIAGAGSGKTRALSHRFAFLVNEIGILPGNILCVTFTNKSANEMRQRIHRLTGDNDTGYINTFHGFCVSVLQEDSHAVFYPKNFLVLDNSDIDSMLKIIYEERGLTLREMTFSKARDMIEILKLKKRPDYYNDMINMSLEVLYDKYMKSVDVRDIIFYGYLYQEKKCFGLDYNDLLKFTLYIFEENEEIRLKWQKRLEYIMIDEFQDIDDIQYKLMEVLCDYHKNLFVVGDPDQTIYTWRGANVNYLLDFDKKFENVKTIMMMENYRSTPQILAVANSLIDKNKFRMKKELIPTLNKGSCVICHSADNAQKEAQWISDEILKLKEMGVCAKDISILYRAHYVTRAIEETFIKREIPYTIYSGVQFFSRMEIKDALCYLRMIAYQDDLSFLRTVNSPKRNIGERRIKFIKEYANENNCSFFQALCDTIEDTIYKGTKAKEYIELIHRFSADYSQRQCSEILSSVLDESGYEQMLRTEGAQERLDNLAELKQSVFEYETSCGEESTLEHYLAHVSLFSNSDISEQEGRVKLMTVHAAKGLEFPHVFICGMNEGIFPSRKIETRLGMEEERRLAFVAMTRAKESLYITSASGRDFNGAVRYLSRFVLDISQDLLEYTVKPKERLIKDSRSYINMSDKWLISENKEDTLQKNQRVLHNIFGRGTIIDIELEKRAYIIKFDKIDTPRAISFKVNLKIFEE